MLWNTENELYCCMQKYECIRHLQSYWNKAIVTYSTISFKSRKEQMGRGSEKFYFGIVVMKVYIHIQSFIKLYTVDLSIFQFVNHT